MATTIAEFIKNKGFKIGQDVIPLKAGSSFHNIDKDDTDHSTLVGTEKGYYDGQGTCFIGLPETGEMYITLDKELTRDIAKEFKLESIENHPIDGGYYNGFTCDDPRQQAQWEAHKEYMQPENVSARKSEKERAERLKCGRETQEAHMKSNGLEPTSVKDVIRLAGFTPNDYLELKEGMVDLGPDSTPAFYKPKSRTEVKLPTEEQVGAKYYITEQTNEGVYMIGNTDTNEAILTSDSELVEAFYAKGYAYTDIMSMPYVPNKAGSHFEDEKLQSQFIALKETGKKNDESMQRDMAEYQKNYYKEHGSLDGMGVLKRVVEQKRAIERASTRNVTTTYQTPEDYAKKKGLREGPEDPKHAFDRRKKELTERKESRLAKVFKEKSSEAPFYLTERTKGDSAKPEAKQEIPAKSANILKRLVQKFGGRR